MSGPTGINDPTPGVSGQTIATAAGPEPGSRIDVMRGMNSSSVDLIYLDPRSTPTRSTSRWKCSAPTARPHAFFYGAMRDFSLSPCMQLNGSRQRFEDSSRGSGLSRNRPPQQSGILGENGNQPERLLDSRLRLAIEYVLDEHLVLNTFRDSPFSLRSHHPAQQGRHRSHQQPASTEDKRNTCSRVSDKGWIKRQLAPVG